MQFDEKAITYLKKAKESGIAKEEAFRVLQSKGYDISGSSTPEQLPPPPADVETMINQRSEEMPYNPNDPINMAQSNIDEANRQIADIDRINAEYAPLAEGVNPASPVIMGGVEKKVGRLEDAGRSFMSGLSTIPRFFGKVSNERLRPLLTGKKSLTEEELNNIMGKAGAAKYDPQYLTGNIAEFGGSIAPYVAGLGAFNIAKAPALVNQLLTGATQGGIAGLTEGETGESAAWGAGMGAVLPPVLNKTFGTAYKIGKKAVAGLPVAIAETAGIGKNSLQRVLNSPNNILGQIDELATPDNLNRISKNLKTNMQTVKGKELQQFKQSKDALFRDIKNKNAIKANNLIGEQLSKSERKMEIVDNDISKAITQKQQQNQAIINKIKKNNKKIATLNDEVKTARLKNENVQLQRNATANIRDIKKLAQKRDGSINNIENETQAFISKNVQDIEKELTIPATSLFRRAKADVSNLRLADDKLSTDNFGGAAAKNLKDIIDTYSKKADLGLDDLQYLKNELDAVIDYRPDIGKSLTQGERNAQKVARNLRKRTNRTLQKTLGSEYKAANKRVETLNSLIGDADLKSLIGGDSIDRTAGSLQSMLNYSKGERFNKLGELERYFKSQGLPSNIIDDLLDFAAAKEIQQRTTTGLGGGLANLIKRGAVQPFIEEVARPIYRSPVFKPIAKGSNWTLSRAEDLAELLTKPYAYPAYNQR